MIIYFSGTGNSRFAAECLAERLGDKLVDAGYYIRQEMRGSFLSDSRFIFVAPTYGWQLPHLFRSFIRSCSFQVGTKAYFVLTCGADIGNAGAGARVLCEEKGLSYQGIRAVVMPENYIALFSAPEEPEAKEIVQAALPVLDEIAACIKEGAAFSAEKISITDRLKSGPVNSLFYSLFVKADAFYATDGCTGCGVCESVCPLNNICLIDGAPAWGKDCTHCMACITGCPAEAIEYGKRTAGKPRYRCPRG